MNKHAWTDWRMVITANNTVEMVRHTPRGVVCLTASLRQADRPPEVNAGTPEPVWVVERMQPSADLAEYLLLDLFSRPLAKLLNGEPLDECEYHAMRALGILPDFATVAGVKGEREYTVYRMLCYRHPSSTKTGIIHPAVFRCSCGGCRKLPFEFNPVTPEQVRRSELDPRQIEFFREHFPEDFKRMQL